jgi:hypothetical protein
VPTDALDCHSSGGPRNHLTEIGGVPTHSVGRASDRGTPAVARQHRAPPGSRTTTVLRPSSGAASKSSSRDRGVSTPSGGPRNRPHQIGGAGGHAPRRSIFWKAKTSPGKITTASVHVAPVHRSLPPSMRSTVTVNLSPLASVWRGVVCPNCLVTFVAGSLLTQMNCPLIWNCPAHFPSSDVN